MFFLLLTAAQAADPALDGLNTQEFHPSLDSSGTLWVEDATIEDRLFLSRVLLHYTLNPLTYEAEGEPVHRVVSDVMQADLMAGLHFWRGRIGVDIPIYLLQAGESGMGAGLGDLALDLKVGILDRDQAPLGLAVEARTDFPTATVENALGSKNTGWELDAIADRNIGNQFVMALNLGVHGGPDVTLENVELNDFLVARLSGSYALTPATGLALEFHAEKGFSAPFSNIAAFPVEGLLSGYGRLTDNLMLRGGIGTKLTRGIGAPDLRLIVGLGYEPKAIPPPPPIVDTDGDGIYDDTDACIQEPEDKDAFQDEDGCPEGDNDKDGFADAVDGCPNEAEDRDDVRDMDGCPDPEALVTLQLLNAKDDSPIEVGRMVVKTPQGDRLLGSASTLELLPGAYEVTGSATNFENATVQFQVVDQAVPVVVRITPKANVKVTVTRDRINLQEKVYFDTNKATIQPRSYPLLDQVAQVLLDYPEITLLRVEGHTDSRGKDSTNLDLSQRRAQSVVNYLVSKGVAADRLLARGFGETRPLDTAENETAWEKNRRVEVYIEKWVERTENQPPK